MPAMPVSEPTTAVGVFGSREQAEQALNELRAAGFGEEQLRVNSHPTDADTASGPPTWESGAAIGGVAGAAAGGLAAGPPGMLAGGLVGALVGTFIDLGVPEQDARWYASEAEAGRVIVTVKVNGRYAEAHEILLRHGGVEAQGLPAE